MGCILMLDSKFITYHRVSLKSFHEDLIHVKCVSGITDWTCSIISSPTSQSLLPGSVQHVKHVLSSACHTSSQYCIRGICSYNTHGLPEYCHYHNICQSQWYICWDYTNAGNIFINLHFIRPRPGTFYVT